MSIVSTLTNFAKNVGKACSSMAESTVFKFCKGCASVLFGLPVAALLLTCAAVAYTAVKIIALLQEKILPDYFGKFVLKDFGWDKRLNSIENFMKKIFPECLCGYIWIAGVVDEGAKRLQADLGLGDSKNMDESSEEVKYSELTKDEIAKKIAEDSKYSSPGLNPTKSPQKPVKAVKAVAIGNPTQHVQGHN